MADRWTEEEIKLFVAEGELPLEPTYIRSERAAEIMGVEIRRAAERIQLAALEAALGVKTDKDTS